MGRIIVTDDFGFVPGMGSTVSRVTDQIAGEEGSEAGQITDEIYNQITQSGGDWETILNDVGERGLQAGLEAAGLDAETSAAMARAAKNVISGIKGWLTSNAYPLAEFEEWAAGQARVYCLIPTARMTTTADQLMAQEALLLNRNFWPLWFGKDGTARDTFRRENEAANPKQWSNSYGEWYHQWGTTGWYYGSLIDVGKAPAAWAAANIAEVRSVLDAGQVASGIVGAGFSWPFFVRMWDRKARALGLAPLVQTPQVKLTVATQKVGRDPVTTAAMAAEARRRRQEVEAAAAAEAERIRQQRELQEKTDDKASWYQSPAVLVGGGLLVVGVGAWLLLKR